MTNDLPELQPPARVPESREPCLAACVCHHRGLGAGRRTWPWRAPHNGTFPEKGDCDALRRENLDVG